MENKTIGLGKQNFILSPEQQRCVDYAGKSSLSINGAAGSGKSTVIFKRAIKYLKNAEGKTNHLILFTFNKTLVEYFSELLDVDSAKNEKIRISTLDGYLWEVFREMSGKDKPWGTLLFGGDKDDNRYRRQCMEFAQDNLSKAFGKHRFFDGNVDYWIEECDWIRCMNMDSSDEEKYWGCERTGRGRNIRVSNPERPLVFALYREYERLLQYNRRMELNQAFVYISHHLQDIPEKFKYTHILIDEAQDQTLAKMICLTGLLKDPTAAGEQTDMVIALDANQRIFDRSWKYSQLGIPVYHRKLTQTFRCTKEIDALAQSLADHNQLSDEEKTDHIIPKISGDKPLIRKCKNATSEKIYVVNLIEEWLKKEQDITICIMATTNYLCSVYSNWLAEGKITHECIKKGNKFSISKPGVKVGTVFSTKGMEFTKVIIPKFEEGIFPAIREKSDPELIEQEVIKNRNMAYVAMTRAMSELVITYSGNPSRFIGEMKEDLYRLSEEKEYSPASNNVDTIPEDLVIYSFLTSTTGNAGGNGVRGNSTGGNSTGGNGTRGNGISGNASGNSSGNPNSKAQSEETLAGFFQRHNLKVIDKRPSGGCLWVVGTEREIGSIVREAKQKFKIGGTFSAGGGRATGYKPAWFTKSGK